MNPNRYYNTPESELGLFYNEVYKRNDIDLDLWRGKRESKVLEHKLAQFTNVPPETKITTKKDTRSNKENKFISSDAAKFRSFHVGASPCFSPRLPGIMSVDVDCFYSFDAVSHISSDQTVNTETQLVSMATLSVDKEAVRKIIGVGNADLKTKEEAKQFLEKYGFYYCDSEMYGGAITTYTVTDNSSKEQSQSSGGGLFTTLKSAFGSASTGAKIQTEKGVKQTVTHQTIDRTVIGGEGNDEEKWKESIEQGKELRRISYTISRTMDIFDSESPSYSNCRLAYMEIENNVLQYTKNWLMENIITKQKGFDPFNILVLGAVGSGKSSFINLLANTQKPDSTTEWCKPCPYIDGATETLTRRLAGVELFPHVRIFDFFGFDLDKDGKWMETAMKYAQNALQGTLVMNQDLRFLENGANNKSVSKHDTTKKKDENSIQAIIYIMDMGFNLIPQMEVFSGVCEAVMKTHEHDAKPPVYLVFNKVDLWDNGLCARMKQGPGPNKDTISEIEQAFSRPPSAYVPNAQNPALDLVEQVKTIVNISAKYPALFQRSNRHSRSIFCPSEKGWNSISNPVEHPPQINYVLAMRLLYDIVKDHSDEKNKQNSSSTTTHSVARG